MKQFFSDLWKSYKIALTIPTFILFLTNGIVLWKLRQFHITWIMPAVGALVLFYLIAVGALYLRWKTSKQGVVKKKYTRRVNNVTFYFVDLVDGGKKKSWGLNDKKQWEDAEVGDYVIKRSGSFGVEIQKADRA